ncbi:hypothetical protein B5M09_001295 [Aphanomyces astaci]|uniref:Chromodomain-helicase-DNA-binding protein 1-like C-terminal domain-containing protein n=1 Tax=Aphanomyces astaci TaxID=112090 RepID=A0A3R7X4U4_APHAT|nr:hypothetical protein B5M09_001295 [Aphanomyces astaci]
MASSSPEKPRKNSSDASNSSDNSDDSSSSGGSSSSSSDSDSDNDTAKDDNANSQSLPLSSEDKESLTKPLDPNPTRAAARLKESTGTGLMALNTQKRDRRTIEQIQSDLRIKRGAAAANPGNANRVSSRRPTTATVSPAQPPVAESTSVPSLDMSVKAKGNSKTVKGRLESKLAGRGAGARGKTVPKATAAASKTQPTTSAVTNISRSATLLLTSSQTTPPETSPIQTDLVEDPRSNSKVVRTIVKALQRYGDLMDGNLYKEHQSTFCDEYKQPSFLVRAKLASHLKVSEDTLASIAKEIIVQCDAASAQKEENVKYADVDIKPSQFVERLYDNLKLRVAVQRAMAAAKFKPGGLPHALVLAPSATTLSDFGIDQMAIWKSAEDENGWNVEKDRALLLGVYIHGAWEEILSDPQLPLEKQRALKGSRLKTRAENLLKKLPSPAHVKVAGGGPSTMMDRAAERAKRKAEELPTSSSPPPHADSIRRGHVQSRFGGKQLQLVTRVASDDEEGEVRSDKESDDNQTASALSRPPATEQLRYGGKDIRIPKPKKRDGKASSSKKPTIVLLTQEQLEAKWGPKDRLKHIRTTLKKVRRIAAWAQSQADDNVVLEKVAKYICEIGAGIDQVVAADDGDHGDELATCLWTHAATFTPFSAVQFERLYDDMACDAADFHQT